MLTSQLAKVCEDECIDWGYYDLEFKNDRMIIKCNSKQIYRFAYDYDHTSLLVEFRSKNRDIYQYLGVPLNVFMDMMVSESKGKYLNSNIKKKFNYQKRVDLPPL